MREQIKENVSMFPPDTLSINAYLHDPAEQSMVQLLLPPAGQIMVDPSHVLPAQSTVSEVARVPLMDRNVQSSELQSI